MTSSIQSTSFDTKVPLALPNVDMPPSILVLGMAGSGKTSFVQIFPSIAYWIQGAILNKHTVLASSAVATILARAMDFYASGLKHYAFQRLTALLHAKKRPPYVINLDPAAANVPYPVNIDIRDTVKYKQIMKDYGLGPNGAIITSLNLMCTKFDQVLTMIRQRCNQYSLCLIDTPGQIEAFTWSASGSIITDSLASSHPTVGPCCRVCGGFRESNESDNLHVKYALCLFDSV
ncbi:unnamed protein product [Cylicostephanus goldi]|uniref:GPN-loop GTPase n=1 Tax=Cylicostephanus goldi TaxID=71465 RepID=A0A3P6SG07_CYLGO|nr:unnamed protein product [Cylicostephanus goldi]